MTKPLTSLTLSLALAAAAAIGAPAMAEPSGVRPLDEPSRVAVSYADLNLGQAAGAAILLRRIRDAATIACGGPPDIRMTEDRIAFDQCAHAAVAAAVARVDSPMLTAIAGHDLQPVDIAGR